MQIMLLFQRRLVLLYYAYFKFIAKVHQANNKCFAYKQSKVCAEQLAPAECEINIKNTKRKKKPKKERINKDK